MGEMILAFIDSACKQKTLKTSCFHLVSHFTMTNVSSVFTINCEFTFCELYEHFLILTVAEQLCDETAC